MNGRINRRAFQLGLVASAATTTTHATGSDRQKEVKVAAVQMHAKLGDIATNLETARNWVREAIKKGARIVVLPEFFASGLAYRPDKMKHAAQPLMGKPTKLLKVLAKEGKAFVGGSFLAKSGEHVYNTFVLASPNGKLFTHDKDFPSTTGESSFYAAGEDDEFVAELNRHSKPRYRTGRRIPSRKGNNKNGIFKLGDMSIGAAICWEQMRYRTARRLLDRVDLVLTASGWPIIDTDIGLPATFGPSFNKEMASWKRMVANAPKNLAKVLGVPVVHANLVGDTWAVSTRDGKTPELLRFLGESQVVDGTGKTIAGRSYSSGQGLVMAEVKLGTVAGKRLEIPGNEVWFPEFSDLCKDWWYDGGVGRDYYLKNLRRDP